MEKLKVTPESYARKLDFIEHALADGAHLKPHVFGATGRIMSEADWNRTVNIGLLYHAGPDTTGQSIADVFGVSKETVRLTKDRLLVDLYQNSSKETKKKFPLNSLVLDKPVTLSQREKVSRTNGGMALKVKDLMENEGLTSTEEITARLKITRDRLKNIAESELFKMWGLSLEVNLTRRSSREIQNKVNKMTDDGELQKYLDGFSSGSIRGYINRKNNTYPVFGLLGATLKEMGLKSNRDVKPVALKLKALGLPLRFEPGCIQTIKGRQYQETHFIYFIKHKKRVMKMVEALGLLKNNSEFLNLIKAKSIIWNE